MPHGRLDLVGLVAEDMATTLAFYRSLGLDIPPDADGQPHVEVTLHGGLRLAWDTTEVIRSMGEEWVRPPQGAGPSLAFLFDSPAEVDKAYADLTGAGHDGHLPPWDAPWGQRYAVVHDPDGTSVDLFAQLPEA